MRFRKILALARSPAASAGVGRVELAGCVGCASGGSFTAESVTGSGFGHVSLSAVGTHYATD